MSWQVIDTGIATASANMEFDARLLEELNDGSHPILHLYEWERPSATFGYFIDLQKYLDLEKAGQMGLDLSRRPTGGGIVFHIWDFAFSVLVPKNFGGGIQNTLDNYALINQAVLQAVLEFLGQKEVCLIKDDVAEYDLNCRSFCMAKPTKYDVMLEGKKIAGAAQRKTVKGFLHQGTIALTMPDTEMLQSVLLPGTKVLDAMRAYTYPILNGTAKDKEIQSAKKELKTILTKTICQI